ncbi:MAG: hypothetical protein ACK4YQ_08235 [Phenylobacterium sp.]|uniref:hypothetical protein n=1 Tax=Phenylobacterium sp. TaxID=1871053 RepID=UPI00391D3008
MLRRGGASPASTRAQLSLGAREAAALEARFSARALGGGEQQPRFARHALHVAAVMAQGGFPAFAEAKGPDGRPVLTCRLAWPARNDGRSRHE